jgi:hypothetical protein
MGRAGRVYGHGVVDQFAHVQTVKQHPFRHIFPYQRSQAPQHLFAG